MFNIAHKLMRVHLNLRSLLMLLFLLAL